MYGRYRKIFVVGFALVVFGSASALWYVHCRYTDPETVRRLVVGALERAFPGGEVAVGSAEFQLLGGLHLANITVAQPTPENTAAVVFRVAALTIFPDRARVLQGALEIRRATVRGLEIDLWRTPSGQWNISQWIGQRPLVVSRTCQVDLQEGLVRVRGVGPRSETIEAEVSEFLLELRPASEVSWTGTLRHAVARDILLSGSGDTAAGRFEVQARTGEPIVLASIYDYLSTVEEVLPDDQRILPPGIEEVQGQVGLSLEATFDGSRRPEFEWALSGTVAQGTVSHPSLPYPVRGAHGRFRATPGGLELPELQFDCGPGHAAIRGAIPSWDVKAADLAIVAKDVPLSREVHAILPPRYQQVWDRFLPMGRLDLDGSVAPRDERLAFTGTATIRDGALTFYKFPYRLSRVGGQVVVDEDGRIRIDATGLAGRGAVQVTGTIAGSDLRSALEIQIAGQDVVIDETLLLALPPEARMVARKFSGQGRGQFTGKVERKAGQPAPQLQLEVDLQLDAVQCQWFPYPLADVKGRLSIRPSHCEFQQFEGRSGTATVHVDGRTVRTSKGTYVEVDVQGTNVPLDHRLYQAVPLTVRAAWQQLRPQGQIGIACRVVRIPDHPLEVQVGIDPLGSSIVPEAFPYHLADLHGRFLYQEGVVRWQEVRGRHGSAWLRCSGEFSHVHGTRVLHLRDLSFPHLPVDADLLHALPGEVREVARFLGPDQPISLSLKELELRFPPHSPTLHYAFEGTVGLVDSNLIPQPAGDAPAGPHRAPGGDVGAGPGSTGALVKGVTGSVWLVGSGSGASRLIRGNLDLEAIEVAGFQATGVTSRLHLEGDQLHWAPIQGHMYGGTMSGSLRAWLGLTPSYECLLEGTGARLAQYLRHNWPSASADGLIETHLYLRGGPAAVSSNLASGEVPVGRLEGGGWMRIREADLYRLPVLLDIFDMLSLRLPDGQVFDEGLAEFRLDDRRVHFDRLQLTGQGFSFFLIDPPGRLDLRSAEVDLRLGVRWKKDRFELPILEELKWATDQLLTVRVRGRLPDVAPVAEPVPWLRRLIESPWAEPGSNWLRFLDGSNRLFAPEPPTAPQPR